MLCDHPRPVRCRVQWGGAGPGQSEPWLSLITAFLPARVSHHRGGTTSWHSWQRSQTGLGCHETTSQRPRVTTKWSSKVWSNYDEISWAQALRPQYQLSMFQPSLCYCSTVTNLQSGQEIITDRSLQGIETVIFCLHCLSSSSQTRYSDVRREVGAENN